MSDHVEIVGKSPGAAGPHAEPGVSNDQLQEIISRSKPDSFADIEGDDLKACLLAEVAVTRFIDSFIQQIRDALLTASPISERKVRRIMQNKQKWDRSALNILLNEDENCLRAKLAKNDRQMLEDLDSAFRKQKEQFQEGRPAAFDATNRTQNRLVITADSAIYTLPPSKLVELFDNPEFPTTQMVIHILRDRSISPETFFAARKIKATRNKCLAHPSLAPTVSDKDVPTILRATKKIFPELARQLEEIAVAYEAEPRKWNYHPSKDEKATTGVLGRTRRSCSQCLGGEVHNQLEASGFDIPTVILLFLFLFFLSFYPGFLLFLSLFCERNYGTRV